MSAYNIIKTVLNDNFPDIPFSADFHNETYNEYFTITLNYTQGEDFGDDVANTESQQLYLHWFMPEGTNYLSIRKQICGLLQLAGFTYPHTRVLYESDTHITHIVFECYISETI